MSPCTLAHPSTDSTRCSAQHRPRDPSAGVELKTHVWRADNPPLLVSVKVLAKIRAELGSESDEASSCASFKSLTTAVHVELNVQFCDS